MKKPILADHKQKGKKLITPLNSIANFEHLSFFDEVVPEIFWVDLLIKKIQLKHTVEIMDKLASAIKAINPDDFFCPGLLSHYQKLTSNQKNQIINNPSLIHFRCKLSDALAGFNDYFPNCPINFLLTSDTYDKYAFVSNLKSSIRSLVNSHTRESVLVLTTILSVSSIHVASQLRATLGAIDFNDILSYPATDASQRAASFVRASVNPMIMMTTPIDIRKKWQNSFWQACQQIEPLQLKTLKDCEL